MNIMKEAHKLTREIVKEFPEVDYKAQLGICISYLSSNNEGDVEIMTIKEVENMVSKIEVCTGKIKTKIWEKGDVKRLYVNHVWNNKRSTYGYFTVQGNEIITFETEIGYNTFPYSASVKRYVQEACREII